MNFYSKLIHSTDPLSSKRFISINSWILFAIVVLAALFNIVVPEFYIYALVSLILGQSAMSLVSNSSSIKSKKEGEPTQPTYSAPTYDYDPSGNYTPNTAEFNSNSTTEKNSNSTNDSEEIPRS